MKEIQEYEKDLASIRSIMERSAKFISLSGLSGVLAGIYALLGAWAANTLLLYPYAPAGFRLHYDRVIDLILKLFIVALVVLIASLATGLWLSVKKSKKLNTTSWNKVSKQLFINLAIPLVSGGLFISILVLQGHYGIVVPACLLFYGLALVNASHITYKEVRYLGISEILLGLVCTLIPGYGILFWALGFGVLHIVYGILMHYRYDQ